MHLPIVTSASIGAGLIQGATHAVAFVVVAIAAGVAIALLLRNRALRWTWALTGLAAALGLRRILGSLGDLATFVAAVSTVTSLRWHQADLRAGGDFAAAAGARQGPSHALQRMWDRRAAVRDGWVDGRGLLVGYDRHGQGARIPFGSRTGSHTLVVGATGSGKTVTQAWIVVRAIEWGHAAIVVDPKGDDALRAALMEAARAAHRPFLEWSPLGPGVYNPYGEGGDTEIADKALAAERYTEPHYLRQAQRYLGHAVRAMAAAGVTVSPRSLVRYLDPQQLEVLGRSLPEDQARAIWAYLDSLSPRQHRDLAGTRDRIAVLAESELGRWLDPEAGAGPAFDLERAIGDRAVVLFRLEADRRPLLAQMLGAAIVQDLLATAARHQDHPRPAVVMIDEFSALGVPGIARLFARARTAGMSIVLGTQELSDLRFGRADAVLDQVLGNVEILIAHRQRVPQSAELVAAVAGSRAVWVTSERTVTGSLRSGPDGSGTRSRDREPHLHPDLIKRLPNGVAAVVVSAGAQPPRVVQILRVQASARRIGVRARDDRAGGRDGQCG